MSHQMVKFKLAPEVFCRMLSLPEGTKLIGVESINGELMVYVEHPSLPVFTDADVWEISPILTVNQSWAVSSTPIFFDWNLPSELQLRSSTSTTHIGPSEIKEKKDVS